MKSYSAAWTAAFLTLSAALAPAQNVDLGAAHDVLARSARLPVTACPAYEKAILRRLALPGGESGAAPDFTLPDLKGQPITLSRYRGKVVLLDFWASWCGPCRMAIPYLEKLHAKYRSRGLVILGVNQGEDKDAVAAFSGQAAIAYDVLLDGAQDVGNRYDVSGIPTFVLIDASGRVIWKFAGFAPSVEPLMASRIEQALAASAKKAPARKSPPRALRS